MASSRAFSTVPILTKLGPRVLVVLFLLLIDVGGHAQTLPPISIALTSVGAVDDIDAPVDPDDPGGGGGFDAENYFQNILVVKVATCTSKILADFVDWSKSQSLTVSRTTQQQDSVLAYVDLSKPPGVLELRYRVDLAQKRARASVFFFTADGSQHEPAAIEKLLSQYKIAALQDRIRASIACT